MSKTQAEVDADFDAWFRATIEPYVIFIMEEMGAHVGKLQHENNLLAREIDLLNRDIHNVVVANGGIRNPDTGRLKLQKLDDVVAKLRDELREEMVVKIKVSRAVLKKELTQGATVNNVTALLPAIRK
jgi:hypothetical protein